MQLTDAPLQIVLAFAADDATKTNPVPVPSQIGVTPGAVSYTDGYPPLCALDPSAGGVGPSKADTNGILYSMSSIDKWMSAGGIFPYNSTFQTAVGGYAKGNLVLQASGGGLWMSTVDNNMTDPDTGGGGWAPFNAGAIIRMCSSVYASGSQTLAVGNAKVLFDTVEFDSAGLWNSANKRFVATIAGNYRVSGSVELDAPAAQGPLSSLILKNGALVKQCFQGPQVSNTNLTMPYDAIIACAVGDFIELDVSVPQTAVQAGHSSGSNQAFVYAQLEYLGT